MPRISALTLALCLGFPLITAAQEPAQSEASAMMRLGLHGAYFVPNQGQWSDAEVHYGLRSRGLDVAFRESAFTMHMSCGLDDDASAAPQNVTLAVTFPGSNAVLPIGASPQTAKFNYFVGGEGRCTASNVPSFGAIVYSSLYDGVDLCVVGNDDGVLKYEFHCAPGADYSQIRIAYDGIRSLCIDDGGSLHIETSLGTLRDSAPEVWQEKGEIRTSIPARFELVDDRTYRIALDGPVDPDRELIIDPDVEWMYYLGGRDEDRNRAVALGNSGNTFVAGQTSSDNFEGRNNAHHTGTWDGFVAKVSAFGVLEWMTYVGGASSDYAFGIAVDGDENALVTGYTNSSDFEGQINRKHGTSSDAFVAKVSSSGLVLWMLFLGGSDADVGNGVSLDAAGNALVTGLTESTDFEGRNNSHHGSVADAYVAKVSASGALQWMTYLGGSDYDTGYGVAVDGSDDAYVTGYTGSTDFEGQNNSHHGGLNDAYVVKVSSAGSLQWMIFLGGSDNEQGHGIAADGDGNALVTGQTQSADFEGQNNLNHGETDAFVAKVSVSGALQWMTNLGGSMQDFGHAIALDHEGNVVVTGLTLSTDFEGAHNANHGLDDAFIVRLDVSGIVEWMSYLGGAGRDEGDGIALDGAGNAMVTGWSESSDFEGRINSNHGGRDTFVVKYRVVDGPQLSIAATCPFGGPIQVSWTDATPQGRVALIFARDRGNFLVPANYPCQGTQLGLGTDQVQLVGDYAAGAIGERTLNGFAGNGACGGYLQLLDLPTCGTSNVARIE